MRLCMQPTAPHLPICCADEQEAVQRVAWSGHDGSIGAWLTSGYAAGLVRCQLIQAK